MPSSDFTELQEFVRSPANWPSVHPEFLGELNELIATHMSDIKLFVFRYNALAARVPAPRPPPQGLPSKARPLAPKLLQPKEEPEEDDAKFEVPVRVKKLP